MRESQRTPPFGQSGEMARLMGEFDWSSTELGSPDAWPAEFRGAVDLMLDCRIPMMMGWGPDLRLVYNDGYIPILGEKHPVIWGVAEDVFGELWHHVGPLLMGVFESGQAIKLENELLPLNRRGFLEECYFTLSYSPVRDREGAVVGLLSTAVETTREVVAARRERVLRQLAEPLGPMHPHGAVAMACRSLAQARDVPFHAVFLQDDGGTTRPTSSAHASLSFRETPSGMDLSNLEALLRGPEPGRLARVEVGALPGIALDEEAAASCTHAVVTALPGLGMGGAQGAGGRMGGLMVLGLGRDIPWDDDYRAFLRRIAFLVEGQYDAQRVRTLLLAEAENRYRELFMQALDGIILGRPGGEILAANPAACRILGYSEAELVAGGRALVQDPEDIRWAQGLHRRDDAGSFTGELTWIHRSGRRIPCEVTSTVYQDSAGGVRTTVILRDVSERLLLQAQLAEAQKMEVLGRISGGIAHDFNNLLAVINMQTDLLRDELAERPGALADLELMTQTSRRAAGLVRRLLDFTRRPRGEPRVFNPAFAVTELAPLLRRLVGSSSELVFHTGEAVPDVFMPPQQFEQVVMNLVVNARDAVEEARGGGTIHVRIEKDDGGDAVRVSVQDDGPGIPADSLERIFEPFFTTKINGTGIGLNTVRLLVEELGGTVTVESAPGAGSTFTVSLPATRMPSREAERRARELADHRLDGVRILLAEDQAHLRTILQRVLERAGAQVTSAANGEEALRAAGPDGLDVLVSDVVMPIVSGPELVRRLSRNFPRLAIVLMSGYAGDEIVPVDMLDRVRFLDKPFSAQTLVDAVREALAQAEARRGAGDAPRPDA